MILLILLHFMMTVFVQVVVMLLKSFSCFCNLLKAFTCAWLLFAHVHLAEFQRKVNCFVYTTQGSLLELCICICVEINHWNKHFYPRAAEGCPRGSGVTGRTISWWSISNSSEMSGPSSLKISGCDEGNGPQVWGGKIKSLLWKKDLLYKVKKCPDWQSNVLSGPRGSWDISQPSA